MSYSDVSDGVGLGACMHVRIIEHVAVIPSSDISQGVCKDEVG